MDIPFARSERSTVGIGWDLALVDQDSGDLRQVAQSVLEAVTPAGAEQHPHIRQESLLNTVEVVSGVCRTVAEAAAPNGGRLDTAVQSVVQEMREGRPVLHHP